jgi:integrase
MQVTTLAPAVEAFVNNLALPKRGDTLAASTQRVYAIDANHALSYFGNAPLAQLKNGKIRAYVENLRDVEGLGASGIVRRVAVLTNVIRSVVDEDLEPIYTQIISPDKVDLPKIKAVEKECATTLQIEGAVAAGNILVAFLAASGLRISEALALSINDTDGDCYCPETGTIHIRKTLKTDAAKRTVLLPASFREWFNARLYPSTGKLFPQSYQQVKKQLRDYGLPLPHAYRRFRVTHLRASGCNEDVIRGQVGHSKKGITDHYSKVASNLNFVAAEVNRCEVGFHTS